MRIGILFAALTLIYGFSLGGVFGVFEENIKEHLKEESRQVLQSKYGGDEAQAKKVLDKSWVYFKRAHLHANGLGTASITLILLISFLRGSRPIQFLTALFLGVGSLGYAMFWMFAALNAPSMGSTGAAKESLEWLSVPASGMCIVGLLAAMGLLVYTAFSRGQGSGRPGATSP